MRDNQKTRSLMRSGLIGKAVLIASGMGFPLTQLVIRRFGRTGAIATETVCAGLLVRDIAMIAMGVSKRLRRAPAALLWLEATAAGVAALAGLRLVVNGQALDNATGRGQLDRWETARRAAVGTLFGVHTMRFRIYLQPESGLEPPR